MTLDRKTFEMWKIARIGWGKHQKAWKQEIRREPICYNVIHMYIFARRFISLVVFQAFGQS